jgi:hypothetical protein
MTPDVVGVSGIEGTSENYSMEIRTAQDYEIFID